MSLRRIPVFFEIDTETGEVSLDGERTFFMPVLGDEGDTFDDLQAGLKNALKTYLADEIDTFAEDLD